jgi:hypothetical protein
MKTRIVWLGIILIALAGGHVHATQETKERIVSRLPVEKTEPLTITDVRVNGQSIAFGQKFTANDEWIKSLVFVVKNTSDKRILFASIDLFFSRPDSSNAMFDIFFGPWGLQNRLRANLRQRS